MTMEISMTIEDVSDSRKCLSRWRMSLTMVSVSDNAECQLRMSLIQNGEYLRRRDMAKRIVFDKCEPRVSFGCASSERRVSIEFASCERRVRIVWASSARRMGVECAS